MNKVKRSERIVSRRRSKMNRNLIMLSSNRNKVSKSVKIGGRVPALVNPDLKPFLNLHVNLHAHFRLAHAVPMT